ncbi:hypothetical protein CY34DRAFT_15551 [Suillus luteus UH-Slu-Lm8-n1]|uniref:Uncharacterized protein n=1 Tax=Suillus luteus UH-Slu-Lm8-n1 TaxID=930992 RepID=A0A0D0ATR9_9AGAM|nr:hypothetical protein CY34DRAFT_15551 [Suillus luteus UH-Slu-Lm8-n1]
MTLLKGALTTSATSAPPEVLCGEDIDFFNGADVLKSTPSLTEAYINTPLTLVQRPLTFKYTPILGSGVSIQPGDNKLCSVILPPSNDLNGYTFPSYFKSRFYKSLKTLHPYMTDISLPKPQHNTEHNLPTLTSFFSENSLDTPITAWNRDIDAGRIPIISPPRLHDAFTRVALQSRSDCNKTIPHMYPIIWGQAKTSSIYDYF